MSKEEDIKEQTNPKKINDRIRKEIDSADKLYKTLDAIKASLTEDEWAYVCYGMYAGMRYHDNALCRMAMLEKIQSGGAAIKRLIDNVIKKIEEEETDDE